MENIKDSKLHPFVRTLGEGPYALVGFFALVLPSEANQGRNNFHLAPTNLKSGCGSCAHCGHGIINNYIVQNGAGERFPIGSDCLEKVDLPYEMVTKLRRLEKDRRRVLRKARVVAKGAAARTQLKELLVSHADVLKATIVSKAGHTLYGQVTWCLNRSSDGGIVIILKRVLKALTQEVL